MKIQKSTKIQKKNTEQDRTSETRTYNKETYKQNKKRTCLRNQHRRQDTHSTNKIYKIHKKEYENDIQTRSIE